MSTTPKPTGTKPASPAREIRSFPAIEMRAVEKEGGKRYLLGYAAVFNVESRDMGGWTEIIKPGAFTKALAAAGTDVLALREHDPRLLLGSSQAGTLKLSEDERGLAYEVLVPDTSYGRDTWESVNRRDLRGGSFGFTMPAEGGDKLVKVDTRYVREIVQVDKLWEITITGWPAYPDTETEARSQVLDRIKSLGSGPKPESAPAIDPLAAKRSAYRHAIAKG